MFYIKNSACGIFCAERGCEATISSRASAHPKRSVIGVSQLFFCTPDSRGTGLKSYAFFFTGPLSQRILWTGFFTFHTEYTLCSVFTFS